jgi:hypothetical protein
MSERSLQVTYRKGKPFSAYLHLSASNRRKEREDGTCRFERRRRRGTFDRSCAIHSRPSRTEVSRFA